MRFKRLKREFEKRGGFIHQGPDAICMLDLQCANGGTSLDGRHIYLRKNPAASTVFEELIHSRQLRRGRYDGTLRCLLALEVEAKEQVLRNRRAFGLTKQEAAFVSELLEEDLKALEAEESRESNGKRRVV
jgi:hypothetical protein